MSVRTKVRWVKINIILIRLGVINPRRERIPMSDQKSSLCQSGLRLHRHLGHTRRSSLLQGRAARGEILSAGGRGRQVPNSCSLESSASRVAQRSMDFFTIQRRDVSQRKLFNARVLQGESCTLFPTGTQTIRNRSSNAVAAGSSTSILESDLIHFLSCGAWILIPGDTAF